MRAFLMYIDDWLSSKKIETMDAAEERGYLRLLMRAAGEEDCGLPDSDSELAIYSKLGSQWFEPTQDKLYRIGEKTSGEKLRECFEVINGRLYNARLLKEFLHQKEVQAKRAEAGKIGGKAKANARQLLSKCHTDASRLPEQNASKALANGLANDKQNSANDVCVSVSSLETSKHTSPDKQEDLSSTESVSELTANPRKKTRREIYFEEKFWPIVWAKIGRDAALKAWMKKVTSEGEMQKIVEAAIAQGPMILERGSQPGCSVLHPATWINQGRYDDEYMPPTPPKATRTIRASIWRNA